MTDSVIIDNSEISLDIITRYYNGLKMSDKINRSILVTFISFV